METPSPPLSNQGILQLPNEILLRSFHIAAQDHPLKEKIRHYHGWRHRTLAALSAVCRLFNSLAIPMLYEILQLGLQTRPYGPFMPLRLTTLLHRTLGENPPLRPLCRRLTLVAAQGTPLFLTRIVRDLASWLTGTIHLKLSLDRFDDKEGELVFRAAAQHMPNLEVFHIVPTDKSITFSVVRDALCQLPRLRVFGYNTRKDILAHESYGSPLSSSGRSNLGRSLHIRRFHASPEAFRDVCAFPGRLEHFVAEAPFAEGTWPIETRDGFLPDKPVADGTSAVRSLSDVFPAISQHKATLRTLRITHFLPGDLSRFDLTGFEVLEELYLSAGCTGSRIGDEAAALLAPRLRKFTWSFDDYWHGLRWGDFSQPEEDGVRGFARTAVDRGSALREILINFGRQGWDDSDGDPGWDEDMPDTYPFDRMDRVASEIRDAGIVLSYPPSTVSKEQYHERRQEIIADLAEAEFDASWGPP